MLLSSRIVLITNNLKEGFAMQKITHKAIILTSVSEGRAKHGVNADINHVIGVYSVSVR
jgi:hypothetical protein